MHDTPSRPPPEPPLRSPPNCGPLGLRIGADGTWFYHNSPIGRVELVRLFASVLWRDEDGVYWMTTPAEHGTVEVDDLPFTIVEMRVKGAGCTQTIGLRTNLDDWLELGPDHPLRVDPAQSPAPAIAVRKGLEARVVRSVYYDLVDHALATAETTPPPLEHQQKGSIGLWSNEIFFPLGSTAA